MLPTAVGSMLYQYSYLFDESFVIPIIPVLSHIPGIPLFQPVAVLHALQPYNFFATVHIASFSWSPYISPSLNSEGNVK